MKGLRKLAFAVLGLIILSGGFFYLAKQGNISDIQFGIWVTGILTIISVYTGANVRSKHWWSESFKNGNRQGS